MNENIYDELCMLLGDYEDWEHIDERNWEYEMYVMLCKIQRNWEYL